MTQHLKPNSAIADPSNNQRNEKLLINYQQVLGMQHLLTYSTVLVL